MTGRPEAANSNLTGNFPSHYGRFPPCGQPDGGGPLRVPPHLELAAGVGAPDRRAMSEDPGLLVRDPGTLLHGHALLVTWLTIPGQAADAPAYTISLPDIVRP